MSTFSFGNIRSSASKKDSKRTRLEYILKENLVDQDSPEFLILTDFIPDQKILDLLVEDVERSKMVNYVIASSVNTNHPSEDDGNVTAEVSKDNLDLRFVLSNESDWRSLLKRREFSAVLVMGGALYSAQRSTDTLPQDYIDDSWHEPRCFLSEEFARAGDRFYYPSFGLNDVYPIGNPKVGFDYVNYRTRFFRAQLERMVTDDKDPAKVLDMRPYEVRITGDDTKDVLKSLMNSDLLSIDTETSGFNRMIDRMGCVTLCNDGVVGYFVPMERLMESGNMRLLSNVLLTAKKTNGVNLKFDVPFLWRNGVSKRWSPTDDTMLLAHAINSSRPKGLKSNAIFDTRFGNYDEDLDRAKKDLKIDDYLDIPISILSKYAALDVIVAWRLHVKLTENMRKLDRLFPNEKDPSHTIEWWYEKIMMPTYRDMIEQEYEGMFVDEWELTRYRKKIDEKILELEAELKKVWNAPADLDLKSTKKLGEFIEHTLGWKIEHRSKDKSASTNDDALIDWEVRGMPGIKILKQFRSIQMGRNMFLGYRDGNKASGWEQFLVRHIDGTLRIHTNFNAFGTETFRHKGKDPNLQQLPSRGLLSTLVEPVITVPTKIRYRVKDSITGTEYSGYGNQGLKVKRNGDVYEVAFSQLQSDDEILGETGIEYPSDVVIQEGSIGPMIRTFMKKLPVNLEA